VIHTLTGEPIQDGTIVFDKGRITELGPRMAPPESAEVIDLQGRHVYPGLIEAHSQLGLTEIGSTRSTIDSSETGNLNPNVSAHVAVNPDSELIPVTRANGVLLALSAPVGGLVSGKASVIQLDGWTWEQMTLKPNAALVVNWPAGSEGGRGRGPLPPGLVPGQPPVPGQTPGPANAGDSPRERTDPLKSLRDLFDQTRVYQKAREANPAGQPFDSRLNAMISVVAGEVPLLVNADRTDRIQSAVAFSVEQGVKIIVLGGYDAVQCAELLKQYNVPVIIDAVHKDPRRDHEDYDASYTLPARLLKSGVRFCISGSGRSETWNTRNLAYQAATAAAYGLPYEEALKSVTVYPAEILGIADRVGTLEKGKDATLFVSDGDPLETHTQISAAWIQGRRVQLSNRHTRLFEKYQEKYRQLKDADP
jgi:imidazolonepropionase-like amidohydrolase